MINIVEDTPNVSSQEYDYEIVTIKELKDLVSSLTVPLFGVYNIKIDANSYETIKEVLELTEELSPFRVDIYCKKEVLRTFKLKKPRAEVRVGVKLIDYLNDCIAKEGILVPKEVVYLIYNSIEKDTLAVDQIVSKLKDTYGEFTKITKKELSKVIVINETIYPREVLLAYLWGSRFRENKLRKCIDQSGERLVFYSMRKSIKKFIKQKAQYYKEGSASDLIKSIDASRLELLAYLFIHSEYAKFKDPSIILEIFERRLFKDDLLQ